MRINFCSFKFYTIYCTHTRTFNGWPIRTRPFEYADKKITHRFDQNGIFLRGRDCERLPRLQKHLDCCCSTYLTLQLPVPFKFLQFLFSNTERAFEIYENLHHSKISHYTVSRNTSFPLNGCPYPATLCRVLTNNTTQVNILLYKLFRDCHTF